MSEQQEFEYVITSGAFYIPKIKGQTGPMKCLLPGSRIKMRPDMAIRFENCLKPATVYEAERAANEAAEKAREAAKAAHLAATQGPITDPDVASGKFAKDSAKRQGSSAR